MQITKTPILKEPLFQAYSLTINVQSQHEELCLLHLSKAQYTIPELLYPCNRNSASYNKTVSILTNLMKAIQS